MIQALSEAAFSPYLDPEGLWRASCGWAAQGMTDHAEWLHEMAVDLIEIREQTTFRPIDDVRRELLAIRDGKAA